MDTGWSEAAGRSGSRMDTASPLGTATSRLTEDSRLKDIWKYICQLD